MVRFTDSLVAVEAEQLQGFFVDWPNPPNPETHIRILQQSSRVVLAIDQKSNRVVGFVTALTDGILSASIPLLEVLPEFQDRGIGTELMTRMCDLLKDLYMVDLSCDPELVPFYERFGMNPAIAMTRRNYARQSASS